MLDHAIDLSHFDIRFRNDKTQGDWRPRSVKTAVLSLTFAAVIACKRLKNRSARWVSLGARVEGRRILVKTIVLLLSVLAASMGCDSSGRTQGNGPRGTEVFSRSANTVVRDIADDELILVRRWATDGQPAVLVAAESSAVTIGTPEDVLALPDGRVVVADGQGGQLFTFRPVPRDAGPERWGRKGAGPGEFQYPNWLGICGQAALEVYDPIMGLKTTLGFDGKTKQVMRLQVVGGGKMLGRLSCNRSGTIAGQGRPESTGERTLGPFRPITPIVIWTSAESTARPITRVPGPDSYQWREQVGPLGEFARSPQVAMADSTVFITTGDDFQIAEFDLKGDLIRVIGGPGLKRRPLARQEVERVVKEQLDRTKPEYRPRLKQTLDEMVCSKGGAQLR